MIFSLIPIFVANWLFSIYTTAGKATPGLKIMTGVGNSRNS